MSSSQISETFISVLTVVLLLYPIVGLIGSVFLWRVYLSDTDRPRSWVLYRLAVGATLAAIASTAIAWLAARRLAGGDSLPEGPYILGIVVLVLEAKPIWYAYSIWRIQKKQTLDHSAHLPESPHGHVASSPHTELQTDDSSASEP